MASLWESILLQQSEKNDRSDSLHLFFVNLSSSKSIIPITISKKRTFFRLRCEWRDCERKMQIVIRSSRYPSAAEPEIYNYERFSCTAFFSYDPDAC